MIVSRNDLRRGVVECNIEGLIITEGCMCCRDTKEKEDQRKHGGIA